MVTARIEENEPTTNYGRTVKQIRMIPSTSWDFGRVVALCDDGTIWERRLTTPQDEGSWHRLPDVPKHGNG